MYNQDDFSNQYKEVGNEETIIDVEIDNLNTYNTTKPRRVILRAQIINDKSQNT